MASRTRACDRVDFDVVQNAQKIVEKRRAKRRSVRVHKKQRKAELREHGAQIERDRIVNPPSDNGQPKSHWFQKIKRFFSLD